MTKCRQWLMAVTVIVVGCAACSSSSHRDAQPDPGASKRAGPTLVVKRNNAGAPEPDVAKMVAEIHTKYRGQRGVTRYGPGQAEHDRAGLRERRYWGFKTIKPIGRGSGGAYYYRFTLNVERYRDPASALRAMNRTLASFRRETEYDSKGDVSYHLLVRERIYTLRTDCLMNRILDRYYRLLLKYVLGGAGAKPERHSLLRHHCGGSFALR